MLRNKPYLACALAVAVLVPFAMATAQEPVDQRTYFTFSQSVELPGKTLPAGTYLFKLADSQSNRHIVQVLDKDGRDLFITLLAIPAQRMEPSSDPEVRFMEVAANQPAAIRTWWYPGRTIGHEFIYPKDQARRLAAASSSSVLTVTTDASDAEAMRQAELARISAAGEQTTVSTTTTTTEVTGTAATGQVTVAEAAAATAPPTTPSPPTTVPQDVRVTQRGDATVTPPTATLPPTETETRTPPTTMETRTELPRTATFLPLVGLLGLGSLIGAASLRLRRK